MYMYKETCLAQPLSFECFTDLKRTRFYFFICCRFAAGVELYVIRNRCTAFGRSVMKTWKVELVYLDCSL